MSVVLWSFRTTTTALQLTSFLILLQKISQNPRLQPKDLFQLHRITLRQLLYLFYLEKQQDYNV